MRNDKCRANQEKQYNDYSAETGALRWWCGFPSPPTKRIADDEHNHNDWQPHQKFNGEEISHGRLKGRRQGVALAEAGLAMACDAGSAIHFLIASSLHADVEIIRGEDWLIWVLCP
jgi:hypothetical protein